jgi:electron transport complex protein RnfG
LLCLISGIALTFANKYTSTAIKQTKVVELENAIRNVTPHFNNHPLEEQYKVATSGGDSLVVYPARKDGKLVGNAVESYTENGFGGRIEVLVGFDANGKLVNYSVSEHNETPGLGANMDKWFREDKTKHNIIGRGMSFRFLKLVKDGGDIDAITSATITSRAFIDAINLAYGAVSGNTDGISGATH